MEAILQIFVAFHRKYVAASRRLSGELYGVLADFPSVHLAFALAAAAHTCPKEYVSKAGICTFISASEIKALTKLLYQDKVSSLSGALPPAPSWPRTRRGQPRHVPKPNFC